MKTTPITLDRPRSLRFDLNALVAVEDATGKALQDALTDRSMKSLRVILWAGLRHEDADLTLDDVGSFVDASALDVALEALRASLPGGGSENPTEAPNLPAA